MLLIIGALFDRMAPVLWVIAVLCNITVIHRMLLHLAGTRLKTRNSTDAAG